MSTVMTIAAHIDLNDDGDYGDAYENVSDRLIEAEWELGLDNAFDIVGRDGTARLVVDNEDRRFSPEYASSPIYPNLTVDRPVRIQTTKDGTTRTMQVGWLAAVNPAPVRGGPMTTELMCDGWMGRAANVLPLTTRLMTDVTTDAALLQIIQSGALYPPGFANAWRLGYGRLGHTTRLSSVSAYFNYEAGRATLGIVGDWGNEMSLLGAIRDVVGREGGGVFFTDRGGNLVFWNSAHFPMDTVSDATFSGTMQEIDYRYGEQVFNYIVVPVHTKKIGVSPEVLGNSQKALKVPAGGTAQATIRYADPDAGVKVGGQNAIAPVGSTDFTAKTEEAAGADNTSSVTAAVTNETGSSATITFTNIAPMDLWVQSGYQVRGTKITDYGQQEKKATTGAKVRRQWAWPTPLDDPDRAEGLAKYRLRLMMDAQGHVSRMALEPGGSDTLLENALALTVGSRISIVEYQTAVSKDYFIIGEHGLWRAPRYYRTEWKLMPADSTKYWILGHATYSKLGSTTRPFPL